MADEDTRNSYKPTILAILRTSDLDSITAKRIRRCLQELFDVNLQPVKKELDSLIVDCYNQVVDEKLHPAPPQESSSSPVVKKRKRANTTQPKRANNPFNAKMILSAPLSELLDETELSRPETVKRIWDYIKANNLQNPKDRRTIICDDKMSVIFGPKVHMFTMNKILANHLYKPDELIDSSSSSAPLPKDNKTDDEED